MSTPKFKLPEAYVKRGLEEAKGATLFAIPLEELSREELLAAFVNSQLELKRIRDDLNFVRSIF